MSMQEEIQGGKMKGGREEDDQDGCSKRVRDKEPNTERVEREDRCSKKRRVRAENWSAKETLQMLELRKAIVQTSIAKGSDAWKQIAQQLAGMNPESQARSSKRVAQRWDTLVKIYVSVEEQRCKTKKSYGEVIDERQKRCKTEYRQLWHELIAQGNPGKRRAPVKTPKQPDEAPASSANGVITQAPAASLSPGASQVFMTHVWKFGEIAKPLTEMLDTIDSSISAAEVGNEVLGQANKSIVTSSYWEPEYDQGLETMVSVGGLKKQQDETKAKVVRATQSMVDTMQSISKAASTSESFCLEVDRKDWLMVIQRLSAISQRYQAIPVQGIREEVGADVWIPNVQIISAARSTYNLNNNSTQHTLSFTSPSTSTDTFAGLSDIVPLSPQSVGTSAAMDDLDVFLSHRGPDVKATFVAHLDDALRCAGFRPFLDAQSLMKGNPALNSIDQALEVAQVHIAIVSQRYAESKYCLNELVAMMRSGKPVIPVFYDVEPVDLRWVESGSFAEAFEKHKSKGRTEKQLQEWADALRALAEITGFRLAEYKSDEAKLNREVVNEVARLTPSNEPLEVEHYRVGLEGPTQSCIRMLENMGAGTGMLGLYGVGGIGKTTLAREVYNHFVAQRKFRCMTFLEIHRDPSTSYVQVRPAWSRKLRKQLLWDLLRVHDNTSNYSSWFQKVSTLGPVFIVIDDVHNLGQFETLIPLTSVLHPGSRIIITSRDRSILKTVAERTNDHQLFAVTTLDSHDSNMLFNWHVFHANEAPQDYQGVVKDVVRACGGLPLALKSIGSSLFDKRSEADRETIWPEAIGALRQSTDVMGVLRWSYDGLPELEKLMFVHITCLFNNHPAEEVLEFWKSRRNSPLCDVVSTPYTSLRNLIDKNLVIQDCYTGFLKVHDLLRDLGQEIGRKAKNHIVDGSIADGIVTKFKNWQATVQMGISA